MPGKCAPPDKIFGWIEAGKGFEIVCEMCLIVIPAIGSQSRQFVVASLMQSFERVVESLDAAEYFWGQSDLLAEKLNKPPSVETRLLSHRRYFNWMWPLELTQRK